MTLAPERRTTGRRVFITHLMKTAGTSLTWALKPHFEPGASYPTGPSDAHWSTFAKADVGKIVDLGAAGLEHVGLFSVHMPAWVAEEIAPDALRVSILREPVARTVSYLRQLARDGGSTDVDALYANPKLRHRIANYQTRMFAQSRREWDEERGHIAADTERMNRGAMSEEERREFADDLLTSMTTTVWSMSSLDDSHLERAIRRLAGYDVVGTTDDLDRMVDAIGTSLDVHLEAPPHHNAASDTIRPSDELIEMIRRDNELDTRFFAHVRALTA